MGEKQEAEPPTSATTAAVPMPAPASTPAPAAVPTRAPTAPAQATAASLSADPATEKKLRETVEAAIGPDLGTEEIRAQVVERVVQTVTAELFKGPLPHPRHLQAYESVCPGLADRIVAMAERAHRSQEARLDKAMDFEYKDRRLGLFLGFFALLALLIAGVIIVALGNVVVGSGLLGAAIIGTVIGTFVHGRHPEEKPAARPAASSSKGETSPPSERTGILKRIFSIFSSR
jgi:uncharacterized membrane protein